MPIKFGSTIVVFIGEVELQELRDKKLWVYGIFL